MQGLFLFLFLCIFIFDSIFNMQFQLGTYYNNPQSLAQNQQQRHSTMLCPYGHVYFRIIRKRSVEETWG